MSKITFTTKDKTGASPVNKWRTVDANEVKESVNALYDHGSIGVGIYAPASEATTTVADTWIDIASTLSSLVNVGFTLSAEGLTYTGTETIYMEMDAHASVSAENNTTTIYGGVYKNGALVEASMMTTFAKNAGQIYSFSGTCVVQLETDDVLAMYVKTDIGGDVTFHNLTATVRPFFITL